MPNNGTASTVYLLGVYKQRLPLLRSDVIEKGTLGRQRAERAAILTDLGCALPKFTYSLPRHLNSRLVNNGPRPSIPDIRILMSLQTKSSYWWGV